MCILLLCRPELDDNETSSSDESLTHQEIVSHLQPETVLADLQVAQSEPVVEHKVAEELAEKPVDQEKPDFKQVCWKLFWCLYRGLCLILCFTKGLGFKFQREPVLYKHGHQIHRPVELLTCNISLFINLLHKNAFTTS